MRNGVEGWVVQVAQAKLQGVSARGSGQLIQKALVGEGVGDCAQCAHRG